MFNLGLISNQYGSLVLSIIYAENKAPNNMTSDARKSQIPSLALYSVSGLSLHYKVFSSKITPNLFYFVVKNQYQHLEHYTHMAPYKQ